MPNPDNIRSTAILFLILLLNVTFAFSQDSVSSILFSPQRFDLDRYKVVQGDPNEATFYFQDGAKYFLHQSDTINYLYSVVHLSDIDLRTGRFNKAFDLLWDALPMANQISNKLPLFEIHQMLGILYQVYGKDSIALDHTKEGLKISKAYAKEYPVKARLVSSYLNVAVQCVAMKDYSSAIHYLDSCYISDTSNERLFFVDAVYGQVYLQQKDYKKAKKYLTGVVPYLEKIGNGFQTSVNYYMGELYSETNMTDSAIYFYRKSLTAIDSLQNNLKLKPVVLESLARKYAKTGQNRKAFEYMQDAKILSDSLFNTQSKQNKDLFEIKNRYKEDLLKKEKEFSTQNQLLQISNKARTRLRLLVGLIVLLAIIALFTIRLRSKMKQMVYEKVLNDEKNEAILDVKNKELTVNALQMIEKEQAVKELLDTVMTKSPDTYKILHRKYKQRSKIIWEDFDLRFTQTNDQFYRRLVELYPDLTPTDLKHCALIKLNFDSKEMSQLLGISVNSVHMARSRIRKKLGLNREDSLSSHLASLSSHLAQI